MWRVHKLEKFVLSEISKIVFDYKGIKKWLAKLPGVCSQERCEYAEPDRGYEAGVGED